MTSADWAAWVQAGGSILAVAAGFGVVIYQQKLARDERANEKKETDLRIARYVKAECDRLLRTLGLCETFKELDRLVDHTKDLTGGLTARMFETENGLKWLSFSREVMSGSANIHYLKAITDEAPDEDNKKAVWEAVGRLRKLLEEARDRADKHLKENSKK